MSEPAGGAADPLRELYQAAIVVHDRAPRNLGPLPGATHAAHLDNPLCGDDVTVRAIVDASATPDGGGPRLVALRFEGHGCALSRAAASMMTERLAGAAVADARALAAAVEAFTAAAPEAAAPPELGELAALGGVRRFRSRRGCATLPFRALVAALDAPAAPPAAGATADPAG